MIPAPRPPFSHHFPASPPQAWLLLWVACPLKDMAYLATAFPDLWRYMLGFVLNLKFGPWVVGNFGTSLGERSCQRGFCKTHAICSMLLVLRGFKGMDEQQTLMPSVCVL